MATAVLVAGMSEQDRCGSVIRRERNVVVWCRGDFAFLSILQVQFALVATIYPRQYKNFG